MKPSHEEMVEWLHDMAEGPMSHNPEHADTCNMLTAIRIEIERLQALVKEIGDELYGKNFYVVGWHLNGNHEPLDSWFEDNGWMDENWSPECPSESSTK